MRGGGCLNHFYSLLCTPPPTSHPPPPPVGFLRSVTKRFLCCKSSWFVHLWFRVSFCVVLICPSSLLFFCVSREGSASWWWYFLSIFTYIFVRKNSTSKNICTLFLTIFVAFFTLRLYNFNSTGLQLYSAICWPRAI